MTITSNTGCLQVTSGGDVFANQKICSPIVCATTCLDLQEEGTSHNFISRGNASSSCLIIGSMNNNSSTLAMYDSANANTICLRSHAGVIWTSGRVETPVSYTHLRAHET